VSTIAGLEAIEERKGLAFARNLPRFSGRLAVIKSLYGAPK
jgi:hypothetical protein